MTQSLNQKKQSTVVRLFSQLKGQRIRLAVVAVSIVLYVGLSIYTPMYSALVSCQTLMALEGLTDDEIAECVIAYEPVWAIGTGKTATDEQANETIGVIRVAIAGRYGKSLADKVRIQYGGSMNPGNVKGLMAQPEIDGGLIGGASLRAPDFAKVVAMGE